MVIEKKAFLVGGPKNVKTREKIRLKLRLVLNNHKKCSIGYASAGDLDDIAYKFKKDGYKHLFCIYKSASLESVVHFEDFFADMYCNEVDRIPTNEEDVAQSYTYFMYIVCKKSKRAF